MTFRVLFMASQFPPLAVILVAAIKYAIYFSYYAESNRVEVNSGWVGKSTIEVFLLFPIHSEQWWSICSNVEFIFFVMSSDKILSIIGHPERSWLNL